MIVRSESLLLMHLLSRLRKTLTIIRHPIRTPEWALIRGVFGRAILVAIRPQDQLVALPRMRAADANSVFIIIIYPHPPLWRFSNA